MDYVHKSKPYAHQQEWWEKTRDLKAWGLLWETGSCKTKPAIDTAAWQFLNGTIDCLVIIAPPGVERNWLTDELPVHLPDAVAAQSHKVLYQTRKSKTKWHKSQLDALLRFSGLAIIAVSYNAFMTADCKKYLWRLLQKRRCMMVLDESHHIKTPGSKRTLSIVAAGKWATTRRILTGTAYPEGPFDVYAQVRFLDPEFWQREGIGSTAAEFRTHFGEYLTAEQVKREKGYDPGYDKLIDYRNVEQLSELLRKITCVIEKKDVLDLPPKVYQPKRLFTMTPEQERLYTELREEFITELDGQTIDARLAITRLLRFQQIVCGYIRAEAEEPELLIPGGNPRLDVMEDIRDSLSKKTIVWCRFRRDVDQVMGLLGNTAVRYDGSLDDDECEASKNEFKRGDAQWIVATQSKMKEGLTLTEAHHTVYYSQSYKYLDRVQSEDRPHRGGLTHSVDYTDIVCEATVDETIISALRRKDDMVSRISGRAMRDWI